MHLFGKVLEAIGMVTVGLALVMGIDGAGMGKQFAIAMAGVACFYFGRQLERRAT